MQAPGLFDTPDKRGKYGLVHNIGLGGAVVCSLLRRPEFYAKGGDDGRARCVSPASSKGTLTHICVSTALTPLLDSISVPSMSMLIGLATTMPTSAVLSLERM